MSRPQNACSLWRFSTGRIPASPPIFSFEKEKEPEDELGVKRGMKIFEKQIPLSRLFSGLSIYFIYSYARIPREYRGIAGNIVHEFAQTLDKKRSSSKFYDSRQL